MNPAIVRPTGPIDPEVGVVYIESAQGAPLVTIVNFALHVAVVGEVLATAASRLLMELFPRP